MTQEQLMKAVQGVLIGTARKQEIIGLLNRYFSQRQGEVAAKISAPNHRKKNGQTFLLNGKVYRCRVLDRNTLELMDWKVYYADRVISFFEWLERLINKFRK